MTRAEDIGANLEELYKAGTQELPPIAGAFRSASTSLSGVSARTAFTRPSDIGLGATGPMTAFDSLVDALTTTTKKSADVMDDVADSVKLAAQDYARTEDAIRAAFLAAGGEL